MIVTETETRKPEESNSKYKFVEFIQVSCKISFQMDVTVLIVAKQAGNICINGVYVKSLSLKGSN